MDRSGALGQDTDPDEGRPNNLARVLNKGRGAASKSGKSLLRVMKNDSERHAMPRANSAHSVSHGDAITPARSAQRTMTHRKDDTIALKQRDNFYAGLHARSLFGQREFAAGEITSRL